MRFKEPSSNIGSLSTVTAFKDADSEKIKKHQQN